MHHTLETILLSAKESFFMALNAIKINKLRSFLTLLGIAVGVFSIIGVMTAMGALVNSIEQGMSELGANTFQVQKYPAFGHGGPRERAKYRNRKDLSYEDGLLVKEHASFAKAVGLESWEGGRIVKLASGEKTNPEIGVAGEDVDGFTTNNWNILEGRLFTNQEVASARRVTVLGMSVVKKLFPHSNPLGQSIRVDGKEYEVIGTIEPRGQMLGGNQGNYIAIPITTFLQVYGKDRSIHIMVQSTAPETFDDCVEQVKGILRTAR
ncbi:MAG: peptide ABC transporter permease, partial [Bacteroidetes bacterium]